nr:fatty acyl-AMP ligase [uncultured Methylophaga sp.]
MFQKTKLTDNEILSAVSYLEIQNVLALRAKLYPSKVVFTFLDDSGIETEKVTYGELFSSAFSIAQYLTENTEEGARVLLFYPQGLDFIAAFFGCLFAQRVAVPINLPNKRRIDKCVSVIKDCDAHDALLPERISDKLISAFDGEDSIASLNWHIAENIEKNLDHPIDNLLQKPFSNSIAFLQYTSGSTSNPKGVMVTHRNLTTNLEMMRDSWNLSNHTDMVFWQPHHHDMGLIMGQLLPVFLGNHTVLMSPNTVVRQPALWLKAISDYKATLSGGPNFIYDMAINRYSEKRMENIDLSCWQIAPNGADVVRATTLHRFSELYEKHGFRYETFMPCYGLAEATLFVTGGPTKVDPIIDVFDAELIEKQQIAIKSSDKEGVKPLVACGEPNWQIDLLIMNPETQLPCNHDEVGEIWVAGPNITNGYWNNAEATYETFVKYKYNGIEKIFLRTGDIGFIGQHKQIYICGRLKDLIISDGRNIHPEDIEYTISETLKKITPQSCAVFSYENIDRKSFTVAVVETDREIKRLLKDPNNGYKLSILTSVTEAHGIGLSDVIFIPPATLKKTTSGKVQRSVMKKLFLDGQLEKIN